MTTPVLGSDTALSTAVADEYMALADSLERANAGVWEAPSLCEGWRTREVVAHVTMPARYSGPEFMAELRAAGGDFSVLSNTIAARDGRLPTSALLTGLRSPTLHNWEPPGGGVRGALVHCVIHELDVVEAVPLPRVVPADRIATVLEIVADPAAPNMFGVDLEGVALHADDLDWTCGSGEVVSGPAQALALVVCGRSLPAGRLSGAGAVRFSRA